MVLDCVYCTNIRIKENKNHSLNTLVPDILNLNAEDFAKLINQHPKSYLRKRLCQSSVLCAFKILVKHSNLNINTVNISQSQLFDENWNIEESRSAKNLPKIQENREFVFKDTQHLNK